MRLAFVFAVALCAPLVYARDAAADQKCLGTCLNDVFASGNQTQEVIECVNDSNGVSQSTKCFCNSDPLIDQLTACVKSNCKSGVFYDVQKGCDKVGAQVPENSAVGASRLSLTALIATGIALLAAT